MDAVGLWLLIQSFSLTTTVSMKLSDLKDIPPRSGPFLQLWSPLPSFQVPFFLWRLLHLGTVIFHHTLFFLEPQAVHFQKLIMQWESSLLYFMSVLTGGFESCHFSLEQVFSKFTRSPQQLQLASSRLCLKVCWFSFRHLPLHAVVHLYGLRFWVFFPVMNKS